MKRHRRPSETNRDMEILLPRSQNRDLGHPPLCGRRLDQRFPRVAAGLALFELAVVLFSVCAQALVAQASETIPDTQQQLILDLTNQDRASQNLPPLRWSPALAAAAMLHAQAIAKANNLTHQLAGEPDVRTRAAQAGAHFEAIAENIAYGFSAPSIEQRWMQSAPHRANILDPRMNSIGIALVHADGTLWAVEDFSAGEPERTTAQIERVVAGKLVAMGLGISPAASDEQAAARAACPQFEGNAGARARFVVRWESSDLSTLPQPLEDAIASKQYTHAAVAACPATNPRNAGFTAYRVAVLLF